MLAMHGKFCAKSDVYSFGVLVLEIISGKRINGFYQSGYGEDLLSYVSTSLNYYNYLYAQLDNN